MAAELLHGAAVLLVSVFAYSAGHAAGSPAARPRPGPADVAAAPAVAAALLLASLGLPAGLGLAVAALGGLLAGLAVVRALGGSPTGAGAGPDRPPGDGGEPAWRRFLLRVGDVQGRLSLSLFYFLVLPPFALIARLAGDRLRLRPPRDGAGSHWRTAEPDDRDGDLRRPY